VNKDFSEMFGVFSRYTEIPDELPYGAPRPSSAAVAA
jgi:hypothetical protein